MCFLSFFEMCSSERQTSHVLTHSPNVDKAGAELGLEPRARNSAPASLPVKRLCSKHLSYHLLPSEVCTSKKLELGIETGYQIQEF